MTSICSDEYVLGCLTFFSLGALRILVVFLLVLTSFLSFLVISIFQFVCFVFDCWCCLILSCLILRFFSLPFFLPPSLSLSLCSSLGLFACVVYFYIQIQRTCFGHHKLHFFLFLDFFFLIYLFIYFFVIVFHALLRVSFELSFLSFFNNIYESFSCLFYYPWFSIVSLQYLFKAERNQFQFK